MREMRRRLACRRAFDYCTSFQLKVARVAGGLKIAPAAPYFG